jgi:hypothetical protein
MLTSVGRLQAPQPFTEDQSLHNPVTIHARDHLKLIMIEARLLKRGESLLYGREPRLGCFRALENGTALGATFAQFSKGLRRLLLSRS